MTPEQVEVRGELRPDGTLVLEEKPKLPAGRVKVVIQALETAGGAADPLAVLEQIWADRKQRGARPRSAQEIDAELNAMRDEWDDHQQALERIQEDARGGREHE